MTKTSPTSPDQLSIPYLKGYLDFCTKDKWKNPYKGVDSEKEEEYNDGFIHVYRHLDDDSLLSHAESVLRSLD